jgi:transposase
MAKDFGIFDSCLRNWVQGADVEAGRRPGVRASECAELGEVNKGDRLLEQESEVLRRVAVYFAWAHLLGK